MSRSAPAIGGDGAQPSRRTDPTWFGVLLALLMVAASQAAVPVSAQTTADPAVRQAISAYEAGELERALALLDAIPSSLPARDAAVRSVYQGLIHFAFGDAGRAHEAFARAVVLEPRLALNPDIHSPTRIRAFEAARDSVVATWRAAATDAEGSGDLQRASRQLQNVLLAMPDDTAAANKLIAINAAMATPQMSAEPPPVTTRTAVDSARVDASAADSAATTGAPPAAPAAPVRVYDPGQAALLGIIFPGLGEFYTGRKLRGALLMGAAAGAVAFGMMTESREVQCLSVPVDNFCPPEEVVGERVTRPYLAPSLGAAAALTVIGAIDAFFGARRANERAAAAARSGGSGGARLERPALVPTPRDLRIELLRLRF